MTAALPLRADLAGTPDNATAAVAFGAQYDFILHKQGSDAEAAPVVVASAATTNLDAVTTTRDIVISGTTAITAFTIAIGKVFRVRASGAFTLTNNAAIVTQRGANIVCAAGDTFWLRATAANVVEVIGFSAVSKVNSATMQATTSGTSKDFSDIPAWAKRITLMFSGVSTNGASLQQVQIGDAGGIENTSYASVATTNGATVTSTTGFLINWRDDAANLTSGALVLTLLDPATNLWVAQGATSGGGGSPGTGSVLAGTKALSAPLDRVRLTTVNGTDVFDAGAVNILYE